MAKKFFTEVPHPAVLEEHKDAYIFIDNRMVISEAEAITYKASLSARKKFGGILLGFANFVGEPIARMHGYGHMINSTKRNKS
jgi:hypothetical protein